MNENMKYPCETIADLLPLFHDGVCSESSVKIVSEHLSECEKCKKTLEKIKDDNYDYSLQAQKEDVIGHFAKKTMRKSLIAGIYISCALSIPVIICLISNFGTDYVLGFSFIVLSTMLVFASVTVVPLIAEKKKFIWSLSSFTVSLILFFFASCLFFHENWFFVASISTLFGLSVVFLPIILYQLPLKGFFSRNKGLIAMIIDTILLYAVVLAGLLFIDYYDWRTPFLVTTINILFPWILFLLIRYLKTDPFIKTGICLIFCTFWAVLENDIMNIILEYTWHISIFDIFDPNFTSIQNMNFDMQLKYLILILGCVFGFALIINGLIYKFIKKRDNLRKIGKIK